MFQNLQSVVQSVDPAKLNSVLSAVAESLRGKGDVIGEAITGGEQRAARGQSADGDRPAGLAAVRSDHAGVFGCGAGHPVDPGLLLDDQHDDQSDNAQALDALLLSAVGFSQSGINTIGGNQPNLVRAINIRRLRRPSLLIQVLADLHVPVPRRPVVPGERRTRCLGRQRKIRHHGRRAADGRRPVPLSRQPAAGQRDRRAGRQAELRLAARHQQELSR